MAYKHQKKLVTAFIGDPAGAKAVLAYLSNNRSTLRINDIFAKESFNFLKMFPFRVDVADNSNSERCISKITESDHIITGTSIPTGYELDAINTANRTCIHSLSIVDHSYNVSSRFIKEGRLILPNKILVPTQKTKIQAIKEGLPEHIVDVMENPYHKYLRSWSPKISYSDFLCKLGINEKNAEYLLFVPEPISTFSLEEKYGFNEIQAFEEINSVFCKGNLQNTYLVTKGHPHQKHDLFTNWIQKTTHSNSIYIKDEDMNTLMYYSRMVIGFYSSALLEAGILRKKIVRPMYLGNCHKIKDPIASFDSIKFDCSRNRHELASMMCESRV